MVCPSATSHWRCTYPSQSSGRWKGTSASGSWSCKDVAGTQQTHSRDLGDVRGPQDCTEDPGAGKGPAGSPTGGNMGGPEGRRQTG